MKPILQFFRDLRLLPRIWRTLVAETRGEIEWERRIAERAAAPSVIAPDARRNAEAHSGTSQFAIGSCTRVDGDRAGCLCPTGGGRP